MENKEILTNETTAIKPDYTGEIVKIIQRDDTPKTILSKLEDYHGNDIADAIQTLTLGERKKFYRVCNVDMLADVFEYLEAE